MMPPTALQCPCRRAGRPVLPTEGGSAAVSAAAPDCRTGGNLRATPGLVAVSRLTRAGCGDRDDEGKEEDEGAVHPGRPSHSTLRNSSGLTRARRRMPLRVPIFNS